ncbi:MAG TPA: DUF2165 domain-containing protein [Terracidiphilus sp.]|nr:DUF2165 domain-containing protein [Terracidiphilus sp.]
MVTRIAKLALVAAVASYYTLVVFNNITDFGSNYEFVRHVLMMDSTFPGNHGLWRAINSPSIHLVFYLGIIAWEAITGVLLWWGSIALLRALCRDAHTFQCAKRISVAGLTLSMLMWLVAFLTIGGEWFLMWQSRLWNGQDAAFRMFAVVGIVLIVLLHPETDAQL